MAGNDDAEVETPAERLRAALELTELTERMLVQRLRREGATEEQAQALLLAWREEPGTHAGDPWFVPRPLGREP